MSDQQNIAICCGVTGVSTVLILILILIPMSYSRVYYYEYGLEKSRTTGKVNRNEVYYSGNHFLGPDNLFVIYPASYQNLYLPDLSIWSRASLTDAGTLLNVDVSFQYQLIGKNLGKLYDKVGENYETLIQNLAISSIKNEAVNYSADEYLSSRRTIEDNMFKSLKDTLFSNADTNLESFQLRTIRFPDLFYQRKLDAAIQNQKNNAEQYKKESQIIRGETDQQVAYILNDANYVIELAKAQAKNKVKNAENNATQIIQNARNDGLYILEKLLNIQSKDHILSLDYILQLEKQKQQMEYLINFEKLSVVVN